MSHANLMRDFQRAHAGVLAFVESCPDEAWTRLLPDGERTVAAVAMHIGRGYGFQREAFEALSRGEPPPAIFDELDAINARNAAEDSRASREEALRLLSERAAEMERLLAGLTAEQLARPVILSGQPGPHLEQVIRAGALGHQEFHLDELRRATSG